MRKAILSLFIACWVLALAVPGYPEGHSKETIHLSPADQLILDRIDKRMDEVIGRIDKVNERIDFLWATMVGGFLGVMIFVGGLVFWDRRTTLAPAHKRIDELSHREKILEDVLKEFAKDEPKLMERLRFVGLL